MSQSHISCIIPVYNTEAYLAEAIDSILAQTFAPQQIIVVDDGSTDNSAAVAKGYGDRITYVHHEHAGIATTLNHGVRVAGESFLAFLDADDLYHPEKLQRQMQQFEQQPDLELCTCHAHNFWSPEIPESQRDQDPKLLESRANQIITWLARRSLFDAVGPFDESMVLGAPTDWFFRSQDHGTVTQTLGDVLASRRLHLNNSTRRDRAGHLDAILMLTKKRIAAKKGSP